MAAAAAPVHFLLDVRKSVQVRSLMPSLNRFLKEGRAVNCMHFMPVYVRLHPACDKAASSAPSFSEGASASRTRFSYQQDKFAQVFFPSSFLPVITPVGRGKGVSGVEFA